MPPPSLDRSSLREKQSEFIWPPIKTAGLWSLKINCDNSVGAGFPRPIARITDGGGENPPLHRISWLPYFFKNYRSRPPIALKKNHFGWITPCRNPTSPP